MSDSKFLIGKVFISHSSLDKQFVRKLSRAIMKAGFEIWLDEHELVAGDPLGKRIADALRLAKVVVVVVSTNSIGSVRSMSRCLIENKRRAVVPQNVTDSSLESLQVDEIRYQRTVQESGPVTAATC